MRPILALTFATAVLAQACTTDSSESAGDGAAGTEALAGGGGGTASDAYAPKLDLPDETSFPFDRDGYDAMEVPSTASIGVPAYPGARFLVHEEAVNDRLARVILLSTDGQDEVFAHYRQALPDWSVVENVQLVFEGDDSAEDDAVHGRVPSVLTTTPSPFEEELLPGAKSRIVVAYGG